MNVGNKTYGIRELREVGKSPWDFPLTQLRGVIRKTSRYWWLPKEDSCIGVLPESLRDVSESCVLYGWTCCNCEYKAQCKKFKEKHGYDLRDFIFKNRESYHEYVLRKRGNSYGK